MNENLIPGLERALELTRIQAKQIQLDAKGHGQTETDHGMIEFFCTMEDVLEAEIEREKAKIPLRNDKPESFAHTLMYCQKCGEFRGHGHDESCKFKDSESGTGTIWGNLASKGPI